LHNSGNRNYFIDFKRASNNSNYIKISRSDKQPDQTYKRNAIVIFEPDFHFLIEAFSMLFTSVIHNKNIGTTENSKNSCVCKEMELRGIKSWEPEKRPREKLVQQGANSLSNAELLAILIGSGTRKQTAVDLAASLLKKVDGDLNRLTELDVEQLTRFSGIGEAKAITILAVMELSRRSNSNFRLFPTLLRAVK
jgi:DNA repair protein RadC